MGHIDHDHEHVHEHEHEHTYTHSHSHDHQGEAGHTHEHEHTYAHSHPHTHDGEGHTHDHEHEHHNHDHDHHEHEHGHTHTHEGRPADELFALMKYMAGHNAAHTRELEGLANDVKAAENQEAYDLIMEAVRFFDQGNEALEKALEKLPRAEG